jgi:adenylylsulfate kinase-like enzyme
MGISGAGKTTIGRGLDAYFAEHNVNRYLLDSDELRDLFDRDLGYDLPDRIANLKRVITAAYVLERCGMPVIVCNVSHLEHIRQFARRKLADYHEIYLKKDIRTAMREDVKGMYRNNLGKTPIIGLDIDYEQPKTPDLVLDTDVLSENETLDRIIEYIKSKGIFK